MSNVPKKRKSNTNIDSVADGVQRAKMERQKLEELEKQLAEEQGGGGSGSAGGSVPMARRNSIIGAVGSLFKKIKSSSTLNKHADVSHHSSMSSAASSSLYHPETRDRGNENAEGQLSFESGSSSSVSLDRELLERCEKNRLLRKVLNGEERAMHSVFSAPPTVSPLETHHESILEGDSSVDPVDSIASGSVSTTSLASSVFSYASKVTTDETAEQQRGKESEWVPGKMLPPPIPKSAPSTPHRISMAAFVTPHRHRPTSRISMRSDPETAAGAESDVASLADDETSLIRGLCNSVRRTHSSMTDMRGLQSRASSKHSRSRRHLASITDMPEEEHEYSESERNKSSDVPKVPGGGVVTPTSSLSRRQSIWSKISGGNGQKEGRNRRRSSLDTVSPMIVDQVSFNVSAREEDKVTPSQPLGSSDTHFLSKKSSSSFKKFLTGFRKNSDAAALLTNSASASLTARERTPTTANNHESAGLLLKRRSTINEPRQAGQMQERRMSRYRIGSHEQAPSSNSFYESSSFHNRSALQKSSSANEKREKAKVFLSVFSMGTRPIGELLASAEEMANFDAIAIDVTVEGYPASPTARLIAPEGEIRQQLHRLAMSYPNKNGFYLRANAPDLLYVQTQCPAADSNTLSSMPNSSATVGGPTGSEGRWMRVGVFAALKEMFNQGHGRKKLLLYPLFCRSPEEVTEELLRQFIQTCSLVIKEHDIAEKGYSIMLTGLDAANTAAFKVAFETVTSEMRELIAEHDRENLDESILMSTTRSAKSSASDELSDPFSASDATNE